MIEVRALQCTARVVYSLGMDIRVAAMPRVLDTRRKLIRAFSMVCAWHGETDGRS
jgi:hypothetical protein